MQQLAVHGATPSRAGNAWQASPFVWTRPFADTMRLPGMAAGSRGPLLPRRAAAPATSAPSRVRPCNARPCVTNAERSRPTRRSGMRAPSLSFSGFFDEWSRCENMDSEPSERACEYFRGMVRHASRCVGARNGKPAHCKQVIDTTLTTK